MATELPDWLTAENGTRINLGGLTALVAGLLSAEFASGVAEIIATVFDQFVIMPIEIVVQTLETAASLFSWFWTGYLTAAFNETAAQFQGELGPFAFPLAIVIVLLMGYALATVVIGNG